MRLLAVTLLMGATGLASAGPAGAQMNMSMPGMQMPGMKMPAAKKALAKKSTPKAYASKGVAARITKPVDQRASPKKNTNARTGAPTGAHDMSTMPGIVMPGHAMSSTPGTAMPPEHDMTAMPGMASPPHDTSAMPGMAMPPEHGMTAMPGMASPPHDMSAMPGMAMPPEHDMKAMSGMAMPPAPGTEASGTNLPAGNAPSPPVPADHAADQTYGAAAMAMGLHHLQEFHGGQKFSHVLVNIAEHELRRGSNGYRWDGEGWYGGDIDRLWVKTQGDGDVRSGIDAAEVQGLISHAIGPYFNLQGGVRYDIKPNPSRTYATVGVEGLAPGFFDLEAALFLSNKGELMGRFEGSYDQRITQRLIMQPRVEVNAAAQNSRAIGIGPGLSDVEAELRLRYDIRREFAPYLGVGYKRAFGATGRYLRDSGERRGGWRILTGIRTWF